MGNSKIGKRFSRFRESKEANWYSLYIVDGTTTSVCVSEREPVIREQQALCLLKRGETGPKFAEQKKMGEREQRNKVESSFGRV